MSLTLGEAKEFLHRSVDNGVCATDSRAVDRINEAVARLHALGHWVGSVARFGVTVDRTTETFRIPAKLQSVTRAAALPLNHSHTAAGALICDDEYAFILESAPVLSLQQIAPDEFRIVGPFVPEAVDVMGKYKVTAAMYDSDVLAVTDLPALKLMLLAIFREENNMLDLARGLIEQSVGHLASKTEAAISVARRALFTSLAGGISEGTLGYARAKLALALTDGVRMDDHKLIEILGEAERRLMQQGREWRSYLFKVRSGILALPREIESLLRVAIDNCPKAINSHWFDYSENGWGYREIPGGTQVVHRGEHALHTILPSAGKLQIFCDANERNLALDITGRTVDGLLQTERMILNNSVLRETDYEFAEVHSLKKSLGYGNIFVIRGDYEVAVMEAGDTSSQCAWYHIPACGGTEQIVRVVARPRWFPKLRDSDLLQVDNIPALTNMAMAVLAEREKNRDDADAFEARAMRYYEAQFLGKEAAHGRRLEIKNRSFAGGRLRSIR